MKQENWDSTRGIPATQKRSTSMSWRIRIFAPHNSTRPPSIERVREFSEPEGDQRLLHTSTYVY